MMDSNRRPTWTTRPVSRRQLLGGLGLLAGGAALSGCGTPLATGLTGAGPSASQFTFWNLFSGGDGTRMVQMEDGFSAANPKISLNAITLTWGNPYYTKLSLATRGDRPPDVAVAHLTRMQTLAQAGLLAPFDTTELAKYGMTEDKFNAKAWQASHVDGKLYAIPLDTHPYVMYYRTDIAKKAGLLSSDGTLVEISGKDEFLQGVRKLKQVTGKYGLVMATVNDTSSCWRLFASLYWQQGGSVLADNGAKVVLDDDKAAQALEFIRTLAVTERLMPGATDDNGAIVSFSNGQAGFLFDGEWDNTVYTTNKTPYDMTKFPQIFDTYTCQADSHTLILPRDAKRDSGRMADAMTFIASMLDQSYTWAEGGHIPAWLPTRDSAKYAALKPQSNYASVADQVHYDDQAWYSGSGSNLENLVGSIVSAVMLGSLSASAAVSQIRKGLQAFADTPSPVA